MLILDALFKYNPNLGTQILRKVRYNTSVDLEESAYQNKNRRLEAHGFIDESGRRPAADSDDERRRYYRLTPFGKRVLAAELERLRALVKLGEERRVIAPATA